MKSLVFPPAAERAQAQRENRLIAIIGVLLGVFACWGVMAFMDFLVWLVR